MGGTGFLGLGAQPDGPQYNSVSDMLTANPESKKTIPDVPTPDNSANALNEAAKKQRQARGAAATLFAGKGGNNSSQSLLGGGAVSQRMLLGS